MTNMEAVTKAIHECRARVLVVMVVMIHQTNGSRPRFHQDVARGPDATNRFAEDNASAHAAVP